MRVLAFFWVLLLLPIALVAQPPQPPTAQQLFEGADSAWVERTLKSMTLQEKIGQLFMLQTWTAETQGGQRVYNRDSIEHWIKTYHIGGLLFMQGGPAATAFHTNLYQRQSKLPLLMAADFEWGLNMRLDSTLLYPRNIALGAIQDDSLLYQFGKEVARQTRAVGIHVNFAPVVDVNSNPANPVIGDRSFGANKHRVTQKALMVMNGLAAGNVLACAKHFPGHGDTDTDSHLDLPLVAHDRNRLEELELYPFRQLIRYGVPSVMVAHLFLPAIDTTTDRASTLSPKVVNELLRNELGFQGLVFTDALSMQGVAKFQSQPEIALSAALAGNDILLAPAEIEASLDSILTAVKDGRLPLEALNVRVRRILYAKAWLGLHQNRFVDTTDLHKRLHAPEARQLQAALYGAALTLVTNRRGLVPFRGLQTQRFAYLQLGTASPQAFYHRLRIHLPLQAIVLPEDPTDAQVDSLLQVFTVEGYTTVVAGLYDLSRRPSRQYGVKPGYKQLLSRLYAKGINTVGVFFGNPYALEFLPPFTSTLIAYDEGVAPQLAAADALVGAASLSGLPAVEVPGFRYAKPQYDPRAQRLRFALPAQLGFDARKLDAIDSIARVFISDRAVPGMAVLVARRGQILYDRAFGYTDYTFQTPIDPYAMSYDLASVTKVAATTVAAMKLFETQQLTLTAPVKHYLPEATGTAIGDVPLQYLLLHESGLPAWKPYYTGYLQAGKPDSTWLRQLPSDTFSLNIGPGWWLHKDVPAQIIRKILDTPLEQKPGEKMVYSDLGMILMGKIIERITGQPLDAYVADQFYRPLGMHRTSFAPAAKGLALQTPPTEEDRYFRTGRLEGYVNDANSSLLGGVAGHAGLYSTVYDLAKLLTMLQQGGTYGGVQYLDPFTIQYFTSLRGKNSHRGLGWDKPDPKNPANSPCSRFASPETYGHLGFTGPGVWVDPTHELVVIILANRTYPDPQNKAYSTRSARTLIHDAVYRALGVGQ